MLFSRISSLGTGQFTKPVYIFSLAMLTVSLILTSFLLAGCTSATPSLRKVYLISLRYNPHSEASALTDLYSLIPLKKGGSSTFTDMRVGYRGICIESKADESSTSEWKCGRSSTEVAAKVAGDPLDLLKVGDLYKDSLSFTMPLCAAIAALVITFLCVAANCILGIPIPSATRKVGATTASLAALLLLGSMVLQQVTTSAVTKLVQNFGVGVVQITNGYAVIGFGWAAFACALVAAIGTGAVVAMEGAMARAQAKAEELAGVALDKASGGRIDVEDGRGFLEGAQGRKKMGRCGLSLAGDLLQKAKK